MTDGHAAGARRARIRRGLAGAAIVVGLLEAITRTGLVDDSSLPPASSVLVTTARILVDPAFLASVASTLTAWAIGLGIAIVVAVPVGLLLGSSRRTYLAGMTAVELLRPIPSVALIPLAILLTGRGLEMKVSLIVFASAWPIVINTIYGIREVDPLATETARSFGLGRLAVMWRVSLPSASPFIYTGIRVSAAVALIVAISAELLAGGAAGIGTWMLERSQAGVPRELLYAAIVVSGLLGLAINGAMMAGERRLFAWHAGMRVAE